ncbi:hypothetical protein [Pseudomonas putida]|uniref:hypothetical protein n=1 Tax=Pseudomonas putida TaxID=303 RepID=UPI0011209067|nr:hypothetical protein [Pseudomonas putida]
MGRPVKVDSSVRALFSYLCSYLNGEVDGSTDALIQSLKNQTALASFCCEASGIFACSLNAQKSAADRCIPGGFSALNELRIRALDHVPSRFNARVSTKGALQATNHLLKSEVDCVRKENLELALAINELVGLLYRLIDRDSPAHKLVLRELDAVLGRLGL